jgi:hypothetical protein
MMMILYQDSGQMVMPYIEQTALPLFIQDELLIGIKTGNTNPEITNGILTPPRGQNERRT